MQINKATLDFLFQQWDQRFQAAFDATKVYWNLYGTEMPSGSERTVHSWLEQQTGLREWVGARIINNVIARDYTLANKLFELTIGLDANKVADDTFGVFGPAVDQIGQQSALWPDDQMTATLIAGITKLCWDGQYFFDTDHPVDLDDGSKGTYSNKLIGAGYDLTADPIAAWDAVSATAMEVLDTAGRPVMTEAPDTIMCSPRLRRYAMVVANAGLTAQAIKNAALTDNVGGAGVTNVFEGSVRVIVNSRLPSAGNVWYALKTSGPIRPLIWQLREAPMLTARNQPDDPKVFDENTFLYGVKARGAAGYSFPWLAYRASPA